MGEDNSDPTFQPPMSEDVTSAPPEFDPFAHGGVPLPAQIGTFRLLRVIATGGMGTVYLAEQSQPRRTVALKVMRQQCTSNDAMRRFEREADLLARMQHPNIAQVYEAGVHREHGVEIPYYAMEYIPGAKPITAYVRDEQLSIEQTLELFIEVCDAIHHGNQRGVIHRDLKPANILIDSSGRPKVIDFGVARTIDADLAVTLQTRPGQIIGTMAYMSPEQVSGDSHQIDITSDVYAMGVLLYQLLCGKLPYDLDRAQIHDAARVIQEKEPERPSTISSAVRGDLQTILLTALAKDRARRYQSADALRADIQRWLRGEAIVARPPTISYLISTRCRRLARKHPAVALLLLAAILGPLGSVVGHALHYGRYSGDLNEGYMATLRTLMPPPAAVDELEYVRIIRQTEKTFERVPELADRLELPEVTLDDIRSMRRMHGRLMERLAEAGVSTVIWGFRMAYETPHDQAFLRGVDALQEANAGAVLTVATWKGAPDLSESDISPALLAHPHLRHGVGKVRFMRIGTEYDVLAESARYQLPSLILAAFVSYHHPSGRTRYALDESWRRIAHVTCYVQDDPERPHIERVKHHFEIPLSGIVRHHEPADGLVTDDATGAFVTTIPPDEVFERVSTEYSDIFDLSLDELRRKFAGRPVVIADYRGVDRHAHFGREVWGGDVIATGLEVLFRGSSWIMRWENWIVSATATMLATLLGVIVAGVSRGSLKRGIILTVALALVIVFACMLGYPLFRIIVNPFAPVVMMVLAVGAGAVTLRL